MNPTFNESLRPVARDAAETGRLWSASSPTHPAILCVEDDTTLRELLATVLGQSGYRVDVAEDGQAGWESLRVGSYHLLITDHEMPRLSGLELVRRLRLAGHAVPVVMVSGSPEAEQARWDPSLQVTATVAKPFTLEQLLGTVEEVLRAVSVQRRGDVWHPGPSETRAHVEPVQDWGINE